MSSEVCPFVSVAWAMLPQSDLDGVLLSGRPGGSVVPTAASTGPAEALPQDGAAA